MKIEQYPIVINTIQVIIAFFLAFLAVGSLAVLAAMFLRIVVWVAGI